MDCSVYFAFSGKRKGKRKSQEPLGGMGDKFGQSFMVEHPEWACTGQTSTPSCVELRDGGRALGLHRNHHETHVCIMGETSPGLDQCFSAGYNLHPILLPETFGSIWTHFWWSQLKEQVLLAAGGQMSGMVLNILRCTGRSRTTRNSPAPNVTSAEADSVWCQDRVRVTLTDKVSDINSYHD